MNVGDEIPVSIAGHVIAQAKVKELKDGEVTLIVPGTIVRMSTRTELAPELAAPEQQVEGTEHVLLTDEVVKPANVGDEVQAVTPEQAATQQVPGQAAETAPEAPGAPVETNTTVEPAPISQAVTDAIEQSATGGENTP